MSTIIDNSLNSVIFSSILISDGNSYESGSNYVTITQITGSDANVLQFKPYFTDITSSNELLSARLQIDSILSGINPTASAPGAATFGINNIATNTGSFVEGVGTLATGFAAHAAGFNTTASGYAAFSVGVETDADGTASFAAGSGSWARGDSSVAMGIKTIASASGQVTIGHFNFPLNSPDHLFVVGGGTADTPSNRGNLLEVYGGIGAPHRAVKIDVQSTSSNWDRSINPGLSIFGNTTFQGNITGSTRVGGSNIIIYDDTFNGINSTSSFYVVDTDRVAYTNGDLAKIGINRFGINFELSNNANSPGVTYLWTNPIGELYYGSNAVILNNATNFTASNVTVSNVTVTGTASIAFLNVTYESASVIYSTGSNQFGDAANDTQTLYGSVIIPTGSLTVTGSLTTTGDITTQNLTVANITASENIRIGRTKSIGGNNFGTYNPILTYWNDGVSGAVQSASFGFRGSAYMDSIAYPDAFGFGTNDLRFFTSTNGIATPSEIMRIVGSTGFVGIGETSPSAKLEIKGSGATSATTAFRVENSSATSLLTILNDGTSAFNTNHLYVSSSGRIGIGTTTPSASLQVQGNFQISTGSLYTYGQNTDIDSGSFRTVLTIPTSSYRAAFFDYVLTSGSNARAGTVFSVWQGTSVEYADTSTNDIGNTTGVNLLVSMSGANIGLFASSSNDNWSMKALARMI